MKNINMLPWHCHGTAMRNGIGGFALHLHGTLAPKAVNIGMCIPVR